MALKACTIWRSPGSRGRLHPRCSGEVTDGFRVLRPNLREISRLGLVEPTIPSQADAAGTVASDWAGGTVDVVDSPLPESVNVLVRELWRDEVKRRAGLQMLAALAARAALD